MIVQIKNDWRCKLSPELKEIVKKIASKYVEKDEYISDEDKAKGKIPEKCQEFTIVGHIDEVPFELLNHPNIEVEFFKGLQSLVENAVPRAFSRRSESDLNALKEANIQAINIHIPSLDLLMIDHVVLKEDCCTDVLQKMLDDGFGIVACIPRPGQRRPDYILGERRKK